jgi:integrase
MNGRNGTKSQNDAASFTLSREEIERLFMAAGSERDALILKTLYFTGVRREELTNLDVSDVDFSRLRIHVRNGKGGKSRLVPITEPLAAGLRRYVGRRSTGPLFKSQRGGRLSIRAVNHITATAGNAAQLTNPHPERRHINPHLLRHSFARHYLSRGGDLRKVSQLLGHADLGITHAIYGTASEDEIHEEYNRLMS